MYYQPNVILTEVFSLEVSLVGQILEEDDKRMWIADIKQCDINQIQL